LFSVGSKIAPLTDARYVVATTTVWSGASYIYTKDAVKILTPQEAEEKEKDQKGSK
jgi:cardiolipin synthase